MAVKIGLYGILGVYNFGCEAIVRGAYQFIQLIYPNCEIIYFSHSPEFDKKALWDLDIRIEPVIIRKTLTKRCVNKLLDIVNLNKRWLFFNADRIIESVDVIFSIGGDIYTIPEILRKERKYKYYNPLIDFCDRAIKKGKTVIVYGASVGPWGEYSRAIHYNINALSKYRIILCREEESISYLKDLGLDNVLFFPDPAFQIRKLQIGQNKRYIGINLSPLSICELYGECDEKHIKKLASLLDDVYKNVKIDFMFIPHVLSDSINDNDLWFMEKVRDKMVYKKNVSFADSSNGFIGVKKYISQCFIVVSARMHCAINAIDENIPTIFLSYSQKSIGMCKYIYGDDEFLIDLKNIDVELIPKIKNALSQYKLLSAKIASRNIEIKEYCESNINRVRILLET